MGGARGGYFGFGDGVGYGVDVGRRTVVMGRWRGVNVSGMRVGSCGERGVGGQRCEEFGEKRRG